MTDTSTDTKCMPSSTLEDGKQLHKSVGRIDNLKTDCEDDQKSHTVHKSISTSSVQVVSSSGCLDVQKTVSAVSCVKDLSHDSETIAIEESVQSFVAAVHKKYNDEDENYSLVKPAGDILFVPKSGPVKMTASGNIVLPRQVTMSGCEINVAGDPTLIQKMCQKVQELDLMENNIKSWEEVISIIECIPNLTFLNLTRNHLTSDLPDLSNRKLPNLTYLVLNSTMITWDAVLHLLEMFPSINELHLSLNGFESVNIPTSTTSVTSESASSSSTLTSYSSLRKLFFVGNKISDWKELNKLGAFFPNLEFLLISETDLESIDGSEDIPFCFPCLQTLGLNRTHLKSWEELAKLRLFPSLIDVRLNGIPFLEAFSERFRRYHTVALLPNITLLNGGPVTESEREDAERSYIRLYVDKEEKTLRYYELEKRHGRLDPLPKINLKPKLQLRLKVRVEGPNGEVIKTEEMNIDVNQTIRELKKLMSNVAGCSVAKFKLYYKDSAAVIGPESLSSFDRKLHSYKLRDGDELIIACNE